MIDTKINQYQSKSIKISHYQSISIKINQYQSKSISVSVLVLTKDALIGEVFHAEPYAGWEETDEDVEIEEE